MNKLIELTKVSFLSNLTSGKEGKGGRFLMTVILTIVLGLISVIYNIVICETMLIIGQEMGNINELSIMNDYITIVFVFASLFSLFMAMFQMQNAIFHTKDFELLESYPVDTKIIVASKILGIYLMTLFEDFIICLPAIVLYAIHTVNVYGIIISFICMFFVSLISLLIASLVSVILGYVDSKLKTGSVLSLVLYVLLFVMLFFFMRNLTSNFQASEELDYNGLVSIINMSPQLILFRQGLDINNWYFIILFLLSNVVCFIVVTVIISFSYKPINMQYLQKNSHKEYVAEETKDYGVMPSLIIKEWNFIKSKPAWFLNANMGSIVMIIMLVTTIIEGESGEEELIMMNLILKLMMPALAILANSIACSANSSISLEGKNFELLKSYPISSDQIVWSKIIISIIVPGLINMVTCSVVVFVLGLDLVTSLQVYIFAILSCTLCSIIGMICGLIWPMFDFTSDVQVFKQSTAVGMNMLFSFISSIIPIGVAIYLNYIGESLLALIACVFIYGLLIIIANAILKNVQNRFFKERDF